MSLDHKLDQKRLQALTPFKNTELNIGDNKTRTATRLTNMTVITARLTAMIGWSSASRKNCHSRIISALC